MLVPVEEKYSDLTGPVVRHRYQSEALSRETAATLEIMNTPEELEIMLRDVAGKGAVFDGR
jgi:hypothetical protein